MKGAFLKDCEAAYLLFPPHVVNKFWQGDQYESKRNGCKKDVDPKSF